MTRATGSGLSLLIDNHGFRTLWLARTTSYLGDVITATAVVLYLYEIGATPTELGLALAAKALPQGLGPVTGTLADRWDPRRIMIAADLIRFGTVSLIAVALPPFPALLALILLTSTLTTCFLPAGKSCVPRLVERSSLVQANSLLGLSHNVALAVGPVVGAVLIQAAGARAAFALDAASYLLSALVLFFLPPVGSGPGAAGRTTRFVADLTAGLRYVAGHAVARAVALSLFLGVFFAAWDSVGLVFLIKDGHGGTDTWVGVATGGYGLAMVLVPLLLALTRWQPPGPRLLLIGLCCSALGLIAVGVAGQLSLIVLLYTIAGAGNGLENIATDTAIGQNVDSDKLGRVFGAIYGPVFLAETAAYLISGPLLEATSPAGVFLIAGTGLLGVAAVAWWLLRRAEGPPPYPRLRPPRRTDSPAGVGTAQSGGPETAIPARSPDQSSTPIR